MSEIRKLNHHLPEWNYLEEYHCYLLERVLYCERPSVPSQQCMNIFVPDVYLNEDGTVRGDGGLNGFDASSVPVIFENGLAGYMEAEPFGIEDPRSAAKDFLQAGFVYVSCGCRGRSSVDEKQKRCGKSPASLVDLKAGIRFLKHHRGVIPGNMDRIVSVGISAGGAMSTLLGTTGNSRNYEVELAAIGAVMTETDDIFAAQCYCPIIDLEHADMAYEWMFQGKTHYDGMLFVGFPEGDLTPFCQALSGGLGRAYISYLNGLKLVHPETGEAVEIGEGHTGSGSEYLLRKLEASAAKFLGKLERGELPLACSASDYINGTYVEQKFHPWKKCMTEIPGLDKSSWLSWDGQKAKIAGIEAMQENYLRRLKLCPAFDDLNLIQAENQEFGTPENDRVHFNSDLIRILEELAVQFPEETAKYLPEYQKMTGDEELDRRKYLLNPMNYIGTEEEADMAPHFRIRVGSRDADTSATITMTLALALKQTGKTDVDYEIVWDEPHGRADYPGEVTAWVKEICQ